MLDKGKVVFSDTVENISRAYADRKVRIKLLEPLTEEQFTFIKNTDRLVNLEREGETRIILEYDGGLK